jgi:predicted nucleic acid-binding protein
LSYLLDTNAFSALVSRGRDPLVARWLGGVDEDDLFISVLTLGEITRGLELMPPGRRRRDIRRASDRLIDEYDERVLPVDQAVARRWGDLSARYREQGVVVGVVDELIAATALAHALVVVTRNVRHFEQSGCPLLNPWPT